MTRIKDFALESPPIGTDSIAVDSAGGGTRRVLVSALGGSALNNLTAIVAPSVGNDSTQGYGTGSVWLDTVAGIAYECIRPTVGAAEWLVKPYTNTTTPQPVGAANAPGSSTALVARVDHVHAHGNQLGGALHADVIAAGAAGFMSGADKTKLNGIASGADVSPALSSTTPADVGTAAIGGGTTSARADHVHAHGNQLGGALHADVIAAGASGFVTGADKTKIDNILQPASRVVSATTDTAAAGDVGNVVFVTQAATCTVTLDTLAGSLISGRMLLLTWQCEGVATALVIDPGASVNINGSASNFVATVGRSRVSLMSRDGLNWFSGNP